MRSVSVVFPTVMGREEGLETAMGSFPEDCELLCYQDHPTCGSAWVKGAREASGDYIYFAADDILAHDGFIDAMVEAVDRDLHPAALVLLANGAKQSCGGAGGDVCRGSCSDWQPVEWSPTPFIHRDWWPLIEAHATMLENLHYSSDCLLSAILTAHGIPSVFREEAVITHFNDEAGRLWTAGTDGGRFHEYRMANRL